MVTLGIETSCDETAVAVLEASRILSNEVSSSVDLHSKYGGVVPEIASRYHTEYIFSVFKKALQDSGKKIKDIDLISVTKGPGLPGSLLVGVAFAKAVSMARGVPLVGVNHLKAHLFSAFLDTSTAPKPHFLEWGRRRRSVSTLSIPRALARGSRRVDKGDMREIRSFFPFVGMVISGGHTNIYLCRDVDDIELLGSTLDDAVGEAFDKVAKVMGLGYPGGPLVEKRAVKYRGKDEIDFPRALLSDSEGVDFSFSGIKTAVLYYWQASDKSEYEKDRICFSFQEAVADVVTGKIRKALDITGTKRLVVGGGVINNEVIRKRIVDLCSSLDASLRLPDRAFCSDNAAMVAALGEMLYEGGERSDLYLNAEPLDEI